MHVLLQYLFMPLNNIEIQYIALAVLWLYFQLQNDDKCFIFDTFWGANIIKMHNITHVDGARQFVKVAWDIRNKNF